MLLYILYVCQFASIINMYVQFKKNKHSTLLAVTGPFQKQYQPPNVPSLEAKFLFLVPPFSREGLSVMVRLGMWVNSLALEKPTYQFRAFYCAWKP